MKHLAKFAAMAMALSLWSCSDDLADQQKDENKGDFYATITLNLPSANGSRSQTVDPNDPINGGINPGGDPNDPNVPAQSNDGYEIGNSNENAMNNLLIVLASVNSAGEYEYVASGSSSQPENVSEKRPTYMMRFNASDLIEHAGEKLYIFAYCNADAYIADGIAEAFNTDGTITLAEGSVAPEKAGGPVGLPNVAVNNGPNPNFLMTNALEATINMPDADVISTYNKGNPLDLGTVSVERAVSRLDFKQYHVVGQDNPNVYPIFYNEQPLAKVTLVAMTLFNESKSFYIFPRVSDNGLNLVNGARPAGWSLCGYETLNNYVVSTNAQGKREYAGESNQAYGDWFFYPSISANDATRGNAPETFSYTYVTEPNVDDLHETSYDGYLWGPDEGRYQDYKIWRYVTENTIPSIRNQRNGISTGIYFKTQLSVDESANSPEAAAIAAAMKEGKNFYAYSSVLATEQQQNNYANVNEIFGDINATYNYCKQHPETDLAQNFKLACQAGAFQILQGSTPITVTADTDIYADGYTASDANLTTDRNKKINNYGFYCYYPTREGGQYKYFCYYPYYIRHNDNDDPYNMGRMEFATVRNNIYKLQVTNISRIGIPGDTPPDPGTPDEADDVYMKVAVQVLDWVVRINNIIF